MALFTCPDCNKETSDAAPACPHCGRPQRPIPAVCPPVQESGSGLSGQVILGAIIVLAGVLILPFRHELAVRIYGSSNAQAEHALNANFGNLQVVVKGAKHDGPPSFLVHERAGEPYVTLHQEHNVFWLGIVVITIGGLLLLTGLFKPR